MLKCAREQRADKCRNTESGVRVREGRPLWLKDDEQEVKRLGRRRGGGGLCFLLDTHLLAHQQHSSRGSPLRWLPELVSKFRVVSSPFMLGLQHRDSFTHQGLIKSSPASHCNPFPQRRGLSLTQPSASLLGDHVSLQTSLCDNPQPQSLLPLH